MDLNTGISTKHREQLAAQLSRLLADSYTLYLKTHNFHWNVTGPMFQTLHSMFEVQYTELALAVDSVAERIRKLLVEAHETVIRTAREVVRVAEEAGDQATADLGTQRLQLHEKTAWMLRSLLED
jgi:starvation-inducible DNA-binding protein